MTRPLLTVLAALALAGPAAAQPNVVLIVTDDQRYDTLRYMPTVQAELVGKGTTFSNAFVVNPLCCPSRASILTGTWSHTHGVWTNLVPQGGFPAFDDRDTLPVWLDEAGFETMLVGRYLNGYHEPYTTPDYVPPGWDRWLAGWGWPATLFFDFMMTDGQTVTAYQGGEYVTDVEGAAASQFVRDAAEPFFLHYTPKAPHWSVLPLNAEPAPRHVGAYATEKLPLSPSVNEQDVSDKPRHIRRLRHINLGSVERFRQGQLEALLALDEAVAGILAALEETGKLDDTLIIFTSDNGYLHGEHRWAGKELPYDESLRVPLVVRRGVGGPPRANGRLVLNVDLAATVADATGVPASTEGRSLMPLVRGESPSWRQGFLFEFGGRDAWPAYCGFRSKAWKYVQHGTGEEELYRLQRDPLELRNRARTQRTLVMRYRAKVHRSACRPPGFRPLPLCSRTGSSRGDVIRGSRRRDWICAGRGWDVIRVKGGRRDYVRCGGGFDVVYAGRLDRVHRSCERVVRAKR